MQEDCKAAAKLGSHDQATDFEGAEGIAAPPEASPVGPFETLLDLREDGIILCI